MVSIPNGGKWAAVKITTPLILYICISSNGIHAFLVLLFTRTPITEKYIFSKNEHELCHFHHWQIFCYKSNKNLSMEIALKSYARNIVCNEWMNYGQEVIPYRDTWPWIRVSNVWTMTHVGCRWNVLAVFVNLCASYVIPRNSLRCCPFASSLHWLSDGRAKTMTTFFLRESDIRTHFPSSRLPEFSNKETDGMEAGWRRPHPLPT